MVQQIAQQGSTEEVMEPKGGAGGGKRGSSFLRRLKSKRGPRVHNKAPSPVPSSESSSKDGVFLSKAGVPIVTAQSRDVKPSTVRRMESGNGETREGGHRNPNTRHSPPPAFQSAFSGPPRYDWIDIETNAAIKVQAAYRRNKVMWELEKEGKSTAKMRNRMRKRQARSSVMIAEDTPSLFQCCGVGLVFGDATEEDSDVMKQLEREQYKEKKQQRELHESSLRKYRLRKKRSDELVEGVEVVESMDDEGEGPGEF